MDQLESALVIALRDTIKWESGREAPASGTLTPVNPDLPFDALVYQTRDRQLAYRDLILGAAVVEVSVQVGDVWNYSAIKPTLQGPIPFSLPFVGTEAGTYSSQIRHVTNVSIPCDAARYADADLYGRDALIYEILARACENAFVDPSIPRIDATSTIIPNTSIWSLGQGAPMQADINTILPLNRDLFKNPDRNLADRDNQLAGYVAQLAQALRNPFEHALRLYIQIEAFGTVQREPDVYALTSDDGTNRVFQTEPALPGANQIVYNVGANTLQWIRERVDEVHVPQIYAMVIPGIEFGQYIETLAEVPERKDAHYWRGKASQLNPEGIALSDTDIYLTTTNNESVDGGYVQYGSASLTVPDALTFNLGGSISQSLYRISVLAKPNNRVDIAGAQNVSNTSGTLGGATFDVDVPSGSIATKVYFVDGGDGVVYAGSLYLNGETFAGTSGSNTYAQYGVIPSSIRQYAIEYILALPEGPWNVRLDYTNLSGISDSFEIKGDYIAAGSNAVTVIQDIAPIPFSTTNGNIVTTIGAGVDIQDTGPFSFPIYWTSGEGQLHIRKITFESDTAIGRYDIAGTFAGSVAHVDVIGSDKVPEVMRWEFYSQGSASGTLPFVMNYTDEPALPLQIQQVQVQMVGSYDTTPLSRGFQGWRQECLDRAERAIQHGYDFAVRAYGTNIPEVRQNGTWWTNESSENWMAFVEVYNPRVRQVEGIATNAITPGRQYEVTTASAVYDGTTYLQGQKFYGVTSSGTIYSGGTVAQVGAFIKSKPGHLGKPALMPRGLYFDDNDKLAKGYYETALALPIIVTCQPWMIEAGLYVAHEDFWLPEMLGARLPNTIIYSLPVTPEVPVTLAEDDLDSYAAGGELDAQNAGVGWEVAYLSRGELEPATDLFDTYTVGVDVDSLIGGILWNAPYISRDYKSALDNFDSYAAIDLNGLNDGTEWNTAYVSR